MLAVAESPADKRQSLRALKASNFFLADVQTGLGPFIAAYLAGAGWQPGQVGIALSVGGVVTVLLQTPAGAIVDRLRSKRAILVIGCSVLAVAALLLFANTKPWSVYTAQLMIGAAGPFLAPTLAAITLGLVGSGSFDREFGKNQSFNSAGNVACALLIAGTSHWFGGRAIFLTTTALAIPTVFAVLSIRKNDIDYELARGGVSQASEHGELKRPSDSFNQREGLMSAVFSDRVLTVFFLCAFLFHFANAAMLPQLGEMLAKGKSGTAAPFMSACIIVTQAVIMCSAAFIGRYANRHGRKSLLLLGFAVLPVRALLYTLTGNPAELIAIQVLDGIANSIFGVVSILVIADRAQGSGRFNLLQGALATAVGLGAALSNTFGGKLVDYFGFHISFLGLGAIATLALGLLWLAVPETLHPETISPSPA